MAAQALGLPFLSPYLQSIGSDYRHGANYATLASTVLLPNTSLFVTGISPFSLAIQLNQMKEFKVRVDEFGQSYHKNGVLFNLHNWSSNFLLLLLLLENINISVMPTFYMTKRKPFCLFCFNLFFNLTIWKWLLDSKRLPSPDIFGKSLYTFYIGQNDFTSNLAAIGIEGVKQYLPQVVYQIAGTIKVSTSYTVYVGPKAHFKYFSVHGLSSPLRTVHSIIFTLWTSIF